MNKHSLGACVAGAMLDPQAVIDAQIDLVLHGLQTARRRDARRPPGKRDGEGAAARATARGDEALASWTIAVVAVVALGGLVARALVARRARAGGADGLGARPPGGLDLAPGDVVRRAHRRPAAHARRSRAG